VDKAGKALPTVEQIVDRLNHVGRTREPGRFRPEPSLKVGQQWRASFPADLQPLLSAQPIDVALDLEQLVNPTNRFQRNRRDCRRRSSSASVLSDVGKFEERPPAMRPAEGGCGRQRLASEIEESIEPAIGIGLQDAGEVLKMPRGMLAAPIT
jgi:hypothetical protein